MRSPDNNTRSFSGKISRRVSFDALLLTAALITAWLEAILPLAAPLPGFKLGLPNLFVLLAAVTVSRRDAFVIQLSRIVINAFLFGNAAGFIFSLAGGLLSFAVMSLLATRRRYISLVGISILSSAAHNTGQVIAAVALFGEAAFGMLWWLLLLSLPTGIVTGLLASIIVSRIGSKGYK